MSGTDFTLTPNFGLFKPIYNADDEAWGDHWNENADTIDAQMAANAAAVTNYLPLAGGTLTGPLQLPNGTATVPSLALGAADGTGFSRSGNALLVSAQGSFVLALFAGSAQFYGTLGMLNNPITQLADAANPADALNLRSGDARYLQLSAGPFLPLTGGALTGPLALAADPSTALQAATKNYVDQFAQAAVAPTLNNVGRNLLHNSMFNIAQRGAGPWAVTASYTADRWQMSTVGGTLSVQINALPDAVRSVIGDEAAASSLGANCVGGGAAGDQTYIEQHIEGVRRTAGKTITLSFWAAAGSGTPKLGCALYQIFGSGGSPSAPVSIAAQAVTLSTTYTRYDLTFIVPSVAGKTLGTNGDDTLYVRLWLSSGSTNNAAAGNVGVQSFVLALWGVQLEIGSVATPLEKPDPRYDLANCQRFYQNGNFLLSAYTGAAYGLGVMMTLAPKMRSAPTLAVLGTPTLSNCSGLTLTPWDIGHFQVSVIATDLGGVSFYSGFSASADL
jgi:hypothetical protein